MMRNPNAFFLFNPEKCHYTNSRTIYQSLKKYLHNREYGHLNVKQIKKIDEKYGTQYQEELGINTEETYIPSEYSTSAAVRQ